MPRLVNRETGSVVNVPEEKVANLHGFGYSPVEDDKKAAAEKAPAKKAAAKSEK